MPSESGNRQSMGFPPPPQTEPLPCPRCDSVNTKFCYYNNYNLSQPRHFCKSCRRYWTQGGTLRDVPVGGGSRKNSKRSRFSSSACSSASSVSSASSSFTNESLPVKSVSVLAGVNSEMGFNHHENHVNVNGGTGTGTGTGSFTSLLSSQSSGFLALGGYGYGSGPGTGSGSGGGGNNGFDEMGFGLGRGLWSYSDVGDLVGNYGGGGGPESSITGYNTWQQMNESEGGGGGGMVDGDLLAWPDLAISMQAKSLNLK